MRFTISPTGYRRVTAAALIAVAAIIETGGAVRLSGSGLGCPDWPTCYRSQFHPDLSLHPMVEFVNRTITGLVSIAVIAAVLGSLVRTPRRRDLVWLSWGLVAGVVAQIVVGGITVLMDLTPPMVATHFLLSMALLANAVVLHRRAAEPAAGPTGGPYELAVSPRVRTAAWALVGLGSLVLVTGTVVTGTGPHGGDENVRRLGFYLPHVARVHGASVMALLAATLLTTWLASRTGDLRGQLRVDLGRLLAALVAQAAVGYTQYFTDVPVLLVAVHLLGSIAVYWALWRVVLATRVPAEVAGVMAAPVVRAGFPPAVATSPRA